ncbi:hypothetical protein FPQ18DRAFT_381308 [Pyronema domesticum]|uniref:NEDD8-activating enzyme E1 regulatory subunit n=1 Tax=Pyronema omphalodes (strain CBS 100304) TaxID=1076935 RepID=U4KZY5_PYROM|nr:hypothetical protein FPQ18DRAFT_381308 [Pyronema domesticum]CCX07335.1 Similar to NEDD8-activating enzyme E1 regulatory subunit; acc. no. Q6NTW6 [Pyronema omphalodes CBS 100304]
MACTTPNGAPSSKEKKYDRQLRLWGANGQNKLEAAHIALFGASATGCEILKNLVLPSVGKFTIIDDKIVTEADLGTNFFLDEESVGKSRAERTAALLEELNPDVKGAFMNDSLSNLLSSKPELFKPSTSPFTHIIVVSPFSTPDILQLSPEIPTFLVHSLGWSIVLRIMAPTRCIVETHPDSLADLRLFNPWEELTALAVEKTKGLDKRASEGGMDNYEHGHVPYVLLLLKYLDDWKAEHNGQYPSNYKEKNEFKAMLLDKMRTDVPGGSEENYEEAAAAIMKNLKQADISSDAKEVLEDPRCINPTADLENFWIITNAVRQFRDSPAQGAGLLPLSGGFPDMKAESKSYVELQNMYRTRAQRDAALVLENAQATLSKLGRDPESITLEEVSLFTKHSNFIRRINYRPLTCEYSLPCDDHHRRTVIDALNNWDTEESLIHDYIAIRAFQEYYSTIGRFPGAEDKGLKKDQEMLEAFAGDYLKTLDYIGGLADRTKNLVQEVVRAGGSELHVIASFAGGMVAQEIVKVITQQYIPVNNTVIFDGIQSKTAVFEF